MRSPALIFTLFLTLIMVPRSWADTPTDGRSGRLSQIVRSDGDFKNYDCQDSDDVPVPAYTQACQIGLSKLHGLTNQQDGNATFPKGFDSDHVSVTDSQSLANAVNKCQKYHSDATTACQPPSTGATAPGVQAQAGVNGSAGADSVNFGNGAAADEQFAGNCLAYKEVCDSTCANLASKLSSFCQTAAGQDIAGCQDAYNTLNQAATECTGYKDRATQAIAQAQDFLNKQKQSDNVNHNTSNPGGNGNSNGTSGKNDVANGGGGMNPQALMGALAPLMSAMMNQQQQQPTQPQAMPVNCGPGVVDPAACGPQAAAAGVTSWNQGTASMQPASNPSGNFNVGNPSMGAQAQQNFAPASVAPGITGAGVPGGGGGGIPNGGGGSGAFGGQTTGQFGASGVNTHILHGAMGGGGGGSSLAQMNAGMTMATGGSGGFGGYGQQDSGLDLSQFLPGRKLDPNRKIAGDFSAQSVSQVHDSSVNMWHEISTIFRRHCTAGLLRDCTP